MGAPLMKTRRRFLAESAVLLSGLIIPGAAHAWGWRRRQVICPPPCPCPCPPPSAPPPPPHMRLLDGVTGCNCLAPIFCYGQLDGMYYYSCACCTSSGGGMTPSVDSTYPADLQPPVDCAECGADCPNP